MVNVNEKLPDIRQLAKLAAADTAVAGSGRQSTRRKYLPVPSHRVRSTADLVAGRARETVVAENHHPRA
jgi:hypothetical protein